MNMQKRASAMSLYANLMEEAKIRIDALNMGLNGSVVVPGQIIREFYFLQLRMLCELIALGCLVTHGDITKPVKLEKE